MLKKKMLIECHTLISFQKKYTADFEDMKDHKHFSLVTVVWRSLLQINGQQARTNEKHLFKILNVLCWVENSKACFLRIWRSMGQQQ